MSYHILHLLSPDLRVRIDHDQLRIVDDAKAVDRSVPLADVAVIVAASPNISLTAAAIRRMAELNVLLLVCDEKFRPCALTVPYYNATSTSLLRSQLAWTRRWKDQMWSQVIAAKVKNQAANLDHNRRVRLLLEEIAKRCLENPAQEAESPRPSLDQVTPAAREGRHSSGASASESRAARLYWRFLLPRLASWLRAEERRRLPGTREGVNGMLDYGYAIVRTAVLRSLAAHGFIAAIGIAHLPKAGGHALADDLVEPLRPWIDRELREFLRGGPRPMTEWMREVVKVLQTEVAMGGNKVRMLNAIDLYIQSFANAALAGTPLPLRFPMLPSP